MRLDPQSLSKIEDFIARNVSRELVIAPADEGIMVKDLLIKAADDRWEVSKGDELLAIFTLRSWALAYAVAKARGDWETTKFMIQSESRLDKLTADKQLYEYHRAVAQDRNDIVKETIIDGRLSRTETEISDVIDDAQQVVSYQRFA